MRNLLFVLFLTISQFVFSQKEANIWYFGAYAGLNFNSGKPKVLSNGRLENHEGSAVMCNPEGKLLFYTNGILVWDSIHDVMPNSWYLSGHPSSTQAVIIVPKPGNNRIFYIFTTWAAELLENPKFGFMYSELDMDLNSGKGDIVKSKMNILITTPSCEKLTAVKHANGKDYWVLIHKFNSDTIYSYLVNKNGINLKPVKSTTGVIIKGNKNNAAGQMKISPDGKKIGCSHLSDSTNLNIVADFNTYTGKISNVWQFPGIYSYGFEFSKSSKYIYITESIAGKLLQYDLKTGSQKAFIASKKIIDTGYRYCWSLQLAPDDKIYLIEGGSYTLHVIHAPDSAGKNSRVQKDYIKLGPPHYTKLGLPNFIVTYLQKATFNVTKTCINDSTLFSISSENSPDSVNWDFGDPNSGSNNFSTKKMNVAHVYKTSGKYSVKLDYYLKGNIYSCYLDLIISPLEKSFLGKDIVICRDTTLTISSLKNYVSYYWNIGNKTKTVTVSKPGLYILSVIDSSGCKSSDTVNLIKTPFPKTNIGNDTSLCNTFTIILKPQSDYTSYRWNTGSSSKSINITSKGTYFLTVSDSLGCISSDTIIIKNPIVSADFSISDTIQCFKNNSFDFKETTTYKDDSLTIQPFIFLMVTTQTVLLNDRFQVKVNSQ